MTVRISLLSIGNELLDGRTTDTNASYLGAALESNGYQLRFCMKAADSMEDIMLALNCLEEQSDFIIISGGLGPTSDDLTRDAIANYVGSELTLDNNDLLRMQKYYTEKKRKFQQSNRKQAFFPVGAQILSNHMGTASGFFVEQNQTILASLPGVPREFRNLLNDYILPLLKKKYPLTTTRKKISFRLFDMPESQAAGIITGCKPDPDIQIGYRVHFPELEISLSTENPQIDLNENAEKFMDRLGKEFIYTSEPDVRLPDTVHQLLLQSGKTLSLAESCTGGGVAKYLTDFAGSSQYLKGSAVTYSNEAKVGILAVDVDTLKEYGAVSYQTARQMAEGARKVFCSDLAVSITGIAGPGGGSPEKPVGTYYIGFSTENECVSRHYFFPAARDMVRKKAAYNALDLIRRYLLGMQLSGNSAST